MALLGAAFLMNNSVDSSGVNDPQKETERCANVLKGGAIKRGGGAPHGS